jgi:hypothetical protein
MQAGHPERSEGSLSGERSFAALRMTKRDGLCFEMYWPLWPPNRQEAKIFMDKQANYIQIIHDVYPDFKIEWRAVP